MSQEVKTGPFAALIIESSQKSFFDVFPKLNVVLFTYYQRQFNEKSLRQNFFRCKMPRTALTEITAVILPEEVYGS